MKYDIIDGSVVNGLRQPILCNLVLDKLPGYKVFCEPETVHYKNINKSVLNTITFYLEDTNDKEVSFNQETLTLVSKRSKFIITCLQSIILVIILICIINVVSKL